jgi:mRNA interferase MazF
VKRGEIWTVAGGRDYAGKPRPVVVVQDDRFDTTQSVTFCPLTTNPVSAVLFRLPVEPTKENGLRVASRIMVDKAMTVRRTKLGNRVGRLSDEDMVRLNRALVVFFGLAGPAPSD